MKRLKLLAIAVATTTIVAITPLIETSAAWKQNQGSWYYLNDLGEMKTGWVKCNDSWYYLNNSGKMEIGWVKDNSVWYYLDSSGRMKTGWIKDDGKWYYLSNSGEMKIGWAKDNNKWYYLNNSGAMKTGWINDNGKWYFSDISGAMQTGVVQVDDKVYSFDVTTGAMQVGDVIINGRPYTFAQSGESIGTYIISSKVFNTSGINITEDYNTKNTNESNALNTSKTDSANSSGNGGNYNGGSNGGGSGSNGGSGNNSNNESSGNNGNNGNDGSNGNNGNSSGNDNGGNDEEIPTNDQAIFPKSQQSDLSFIGDPMPYYENGKFNIFYLDDIRDSGEIGFHPWSLIETENFYDYRNEGVVIDYSNSEADQDLALGTGSVIKDENGLYHAFFTGFNDRRTDGVSEKNEANLALDFGSQGSNGWNYGYGTSDEDFTLAEGYDADNKKYYQSGVEGLELHPDFVHPADSTVTTSAGAAYRWTVGEDGKIDLAGNYTKFIQNDGNPSWPDGVTLTIYHNHEILQQDLMQVSSTVDNIHNINIKMLDVKQGDNLYIIVTANNNNAWDGGKLDISINPTEQANEAIMHATSTDLKNWTKIYNDTFFASPQYSKNDFRDPYVFYNNEDNKYWMLITTRKDGTGVIAKYVSDDLKNWVDKGVFFTNDMNTSNLECPTLIKYRDYWYLTFSDQSAADPYGNRIVHYRKTSSLSEPFTKPDRDNFDGNGFYAGKLEKDSENNLYLFGWTPTKENYNDSNSYNWGGNLVVHQIRQNTNGDLYVAPVETVVNKISHGFALNEVNKNQTVTKNNSDYSFSGSGYESVTFAEIKGTNKITGKIDTKSKNHMFGFMFNPGESGKAPLNIIFNYKLGRLEFYNASADKSLGQLQSTKPITIGDNDTLDFTILINDSVAVLYVNNEAAFSTRMYNMQNHKWGIFAMDSDVEFSQLQLNR